MRVAHVVSVADAQSIPFEVALRLPLPDEDVAAIGYQGRTDYPKGAASPRLIEIGAKGPGDLAAARRLARALRAFEPDVVHVHHAVSALAASYAAKAGTGAKLVKTEHNDRRRQGAKETLLNLATYPLYDAVVTNSDETLRSLTSWEARLAKGRALTIYNGVDTEAVAENAAAPGRGALRAKIGVGEDDFLFGTVGRLVPQKNYPRLLAAMAKLAAKAHLAIIGTGPLRAELEAQAETLGIRSRLHFLGALPRDEVYRHLGAMDGFVMASIFEGFCNAAVEAAAAGLPLVASDIATLREVLRDVPVYAPPTDEEALSAALATVAGASAEERAAAREAGLALAETYSLDATCRGYLALYERLLSGEAVAA